MAAWFTSNAPSFGCTFFAILPTRQRDELRLTGTLTVNGQTYPLTLGQNGDGVANYWSSAGRVHARLRPAGRRDPAGVHPDGVYALNLSSGNNNIVVAVAAGTYVTPVAGSGH